jgi:hypothetical protein
VTTGPVNSGDCSDGIDNDSDGVVDANDFDCWGPNQREAAQNDGWTRFSGSLLGNQNTFKYVSSSFNGTCPNGAAVGSSPACPFAAIPSPLSGYVLLKRGDTFNLSETVQVAGTREGASAQAVTFIGSYSTPGTIDIRRPKITSPQVAIRFGGGGTAGGSNITVVGIQFYGPAPADHASAIEYARSGNNMLFEDLLIQNYVWGLAIAPDEGDGVRTRDLRNVKIRRNVIVDIYPGASGDSSGMMLAGLQGVVIEENFFDYVGWRADYAMTINQRTRNHCIYTSNNFETLLGNQTIQRNIFSRCSDSAAGVNYGGQIVENLFIRNGAGHWVRPLGDASSGNVILEQQDEVGLNDSGQIAHHVPQSIEANDNGWDDSDHLVGYTTPLPVSSMLIEDNIFADTAVASQVITFKQPWVQDVAYIRDNIVAQSWAGAGFQNNGTTWTGNISKSASAEAAMPDPTRSIRSYQASIGRTPTFEAFIAEARQQSRGNWKPELQAIQVINHVRAGFGRAPR